MRSPVEGIGSYNMNRDQRTKQTFIHIFLDLCIVSHSAHVESHRTEPSITRDVVTPQKNISRKLPWKLSAVFLPSWSMGSQYTCTYTPERPPTSGWQENPISLSHASTHRNTTFSKDNLACHKLSLSFVYCLCILQRCTFILQGIVNMESLRNWCIVRLSKKSYS